VTNIKEEMVFDWQFISPTQIDVEESSLGVAIISGTLLAEGISKNGNLYTLDEMENIARSAEGVPIYVGITTKIDPNTGLLTKNMHQNSDEHRVGKILQTIFDKVARKIKFIAELVNTALHPTIVEEVKKGWGISIGGKGNASYILDSLGRLLTKIIGLKMNHVQLLPPEVIRGQDDAQVESNTQPKEFQESMIFYDIPKPEIVISELKLGAGISAVKVPKYE
jgi:hypothetical protein